METAKIDGYMIVLDGWQKGGFVILFADKAEIGRIEGLESYSELAAVAEILRTQKGLHWDIGGERLVQEDPQRPGGA